MGGTIMWKIKNITDKGPGEHYRYHVSGENLSCEIPTGFHWNVPSLDDDRYFLADDATSNARTIWKRERKRRTTD
jgi:hypothetical protein